VVTSDQRRKQLAREKYLRQQERRAARRRQARIRNVGIGVGAALVIAAAAVYAATGGLNGDEKKDDVAQDQAKPSKAPDPCNKPAPGNVLLRTWPGEPKLSIDKSAAYEMKLATTCGDIVIDLDAAKAPRTVNSFKFLAGKKFFDHSKCHRLADDRIHVLQCGDPTGTGQSGPGYKIPDENLKDPKIKDGTYPAGTVAMANKYNAKVKKGRDTGGSQFFLVFEDSQLPPDYTPFGKITEGVDVLKKIAKAGSTLDPKTQNTKPNATVVMDRVTVRKS
jgi:peptidyl-prolyl cis-trans isomerase B (cyclophilin B)